jgi:hypothetical protein
MMKRFACILFCLSALLHAQEIVIPADESDARTAEKNWTLFLSGGLTVNTGNTQSTLLNNGARFSLRKYGMEYLTTLDTIYGTSRKVKISDKGKWLNNVTLKVNDNCNLLAVLTLEYDQFADIALRTITGLGMQFVLREKEQQKSKLAASINGEFVNAFQDGNDVRSIRLNINYMAERQFSKTAKVFLNALYTPSLSRFFLDYRLEAFTTLSVLMTDPIWVTLKLQDRFNNFPISLGIRRNDLMFITALEISI